MIKNKISVFILIAVALLAPSLADAKYDVSLPEWGNIAISNVTVDDYDVYVDARDAHSGKASLHVSYYKAYADNTFVMFQLGGKTVSALKEYELSYYHKGSALYSPYWLWDFTYIGGVGDITDEWTECKIKFTPSSDNFYLRLSFTGPVDNYLIDDIALYELDENGNRTGDNIIVNGDLELCPLEPTDEVLNAEIMPGINKMTVKWVNPDTDDFYGVNIYTVDENNNEKLVFSDETKTVQKAVIENLQDGELCRVIIKSVNNYGVESDGVFLFGTAEDKTITFRDVSVSDVRGRRVAQAYVYNNGDEPVGATLIMTAYKDGSMLAYKTLENTITAGENIRYFTYMENIPDDAEIELYLCDNLSNLMPLTNVVSD